MGIKTNIEYADSTVNVIMGCNGCELWAPSKNIFKCYAGKLCQRMRGQKGWPDDFNEPKLFPERIEKALGWSDLTGQERPDKPWLDKYPRVIFWNDLSDTFTESIEPDWLKDALGYMERSPHIHLFLTKRASKMVKFFQEVGHIPKNFWLGTTVTGPRTVKRAKELARLRKIDQEATLWLSIEPILESFDLIETGIFSHQEAVGKTQDWNIGVTESGWFESKFDLIILGGESGEDAGITYLEIMRQMIDQCNLAETNVFVKQIGSKVIGKLGPEQKKLYKMMDPKGGDWNEWPEDVRIRELPLWSF